MDTWLFSTIMRLQSVSQYCRTMASVVSSFLSNYVLRAVPYYSNLHYIKERPFIFELHLLIH